MKQEYHNLTKFDDHATYTPDSPKHVQLNKLGDSIDQLEYFRLFHDISQSDYALLTSKLKTKRFKRNEIIIGQGQVQKVLYFVKSGVQMSYFDAGHKTHVVTFTYAPDLCAIPESFSFQAPSKYFLISLTDSELDYISFSELLALFDQSQQIERLFRKMAEVIVAGLINRHIELHALTMAERYKNFCKKNPHLLQLIPHKYIASYLGIDPTNFSKLFNRLAF